MTQSGRQGSHRGGDARNQGGSRRQASSGFSKYGRDAQQGGRNDDGGRRSGGYGQGGSSSGSRGQGAGRASSGGFGRDDRRGQGSGRGEWQGRDARPSRDSRDGRSGDFRSGEGRSSEGRSGDFRSGQDRDAFTKDGARKPNRPNSNKPGFNKNGKPKAGTGRGGAGTVGGTRKGAGRKPAAAPGRPASSAAFGSERFGEYKGPVKSPRRAPRRDVPDHELHSNEGVRLQKLMAQAGVASRRICEEMILEGRVEVDEQIVTELGLRVDPETVVIHVDGIRLQLNDSMVYYAFNKPKGVVSTMTDPEGRRCISDYIKPSLLRGERLFHVGRLDAETEGLLLLTNDGELANRLTHPSYEVPKTYLVQVRGPFPHGIGKQMLEGIELEDGVTRVDSFRLVDSTPGKVLIEVVLHSGKNRIVRRLFDAVGFPVLRLVRLKVGPIGLGDQKQGSIRRLGKQELGHLMAAVGL
ncbi:pseudouridine synthase [Arthrobacter woluwensis]|uniref:pseudouridine synthase n=1 Tax=Arthrobacter woluwensis TaxID=156980 RepID=UPI0027899BF4|nr:pseudouridine synthase [Arthrobacter woluwensis]MDQ0708377.1 pseudouridine synthase [Arthrobacter woluwensis]